MYRRFYDLKLKSQDSFFSDDILALSDSDSDILATDEKANFVDFLDNNCSTLAGSEGKLSTKANSI